MHDTWLVYSTCANRADAVSIADNLLKENLIACANISGEMTAMYMWQGVQKQESEFVLLAKTHANLVDRVIENIKQLHPYEVPCIMAWPAPKGFLPFLQWIEDAVSSPDHSRDASQP